MTAKRSRANGEGSIFPYRNGFAAYAWVTKPDGRRQRKYVYGKTRDEAHEKWVDLLKRARSGPIATKVPKVGEYLTYWLREVVEPNLAPLTASTYETLVRLYISPGLGSKGLARLQRVTCRNGSIRSVQRASVASRVRMLDVPRASSVAARSESAVGKFSRQGPCTICAQCYGPRWARH